MPIQRSILLGAVGSSPPVTIDGTQYFVLNVDSSGFLQVTPSVPVGTSQSASGSVTAPAAAAAIVTSLPLTAGVYNVQVLTDYGGTVGAAETFNNMRLQVGATVIGPVFTPPGALAVAVRQVFTLSVPATTAISVNAVAAGGVAAVYQALIIWLRIA